MSTLDKHAASFGVSTVRSDARRVGYGVGGHLGPRFNSDDHDDDNQQQLPMDTNIANEEEDRKYRDDDTDHGDVNLTDASTSTSSSSSSETDFALGYPYADELLQQLHLKRSSNPAQTFHVHHVHPAELDAVDCQTYSYRTTPYVTLNEAGDVMRVHSGLRSLGGAFFLDYSIRIHSNDDAPDDFRALIAVLAVGCGDHVKYKWGEHGIRVCRAAQRAVRDRPGNGVTPTWTFLSAIPNLAFHQQALSWLYHAYVGGILPDESCFDRDIEKGEEEGDSETVSISDAAMKQAHDTPLSISTNLISIGCVACGTSEHPTYRCRQRGCPVAFCFPCGSRFFRHTHNQLGHPAESRSKQLYWMSHDLHLSLRGKIREYHPYMPAPTLLILIDMIESPDLWQLLHAMEDIGVAGVIGFGVSLHRFRVCTLAHIENIVERLRSVRFAFFGFHSRCLTFFAAHNDPNHGMDGQGGAVPDPLILKPDDDSSPDEAVIAFNQSEPDLAVALYAESTASFSMGTLKPTKLTRAQQNKFMDALVAKAVKRTLASEQKQTAEETHATEVQQALDSLRSMQLSSQQALQQIRSGAVSDADVFALLNSVNESSRPGPSSSSSSNLRSDSSMHMHMSGSLSVNDIANTFETCNRICQNNSDVLKRQQDARRMSQNPASRQGSSLAGSILHKQMEQIVAEGTIPLDSIMSKDHHDHSTSSCGTGINISGISQFVAAAAVAQPSSSSSSPIHAAASAVVSNSSESANVPVDISQWQAPVMTAADRKRAAESIGIDAAQLADCTRRTSSRSSRSSGSTNTTARRTASTKSSSANSASTAVIDLTVDSDPMSPAAVAARVKSIVERLRSIGMKLIAEHCSECGLYHLVLGKLVKIAPPGVISWLEIGKRLNKLFQLIHASLGGRSDESHFILFSCETRPEPVMKFLHACGMNTSQNFIGSAFANDRPAQILPFVAWQRQSMEHYLNASRCIVADNAYDLISQCRSRDKCDTDTISIASTSGLIQKPSSALAASFDACCEYTVSASQVASLHPKCYRLVHTQQQQQPQQILKQNKKSKKTESDPAIAFDVDVMAAVSKLPTSIRYRALHPTNGPAFLASANHRSAAAAAPVLATVTVAADSESASAPMDATTVMTTSANKKRKVDAFASHPAAADADTIAADDEVYPKVTSPLDPTFVPVIGSTSGTSASSSESAPVAVSVRYDDVMVMPGVYVLTQHECESICKTFRNPKSRPLPDLRVVPLQQLQQQQSTGTGTGRCARGVGSPFPQNWLEVAQWFLEKATLEYRMSQDSGSDSFSRSTYQLVHGALSALIRFRPDANKRGGNVNTQSVAHAAPSNPSSSKHSSSSSDSLSTGNNMSEAPDPSSSSHLAAASATPRSAAAGPSSTKMIRPKQ